MLALQDLHIHKYDADNCTQPLCCPFCNWMLMPELKQQYLSTEQYQYIRPIKTQKTTCWVIQKEVRP